MLGRGAVQYDLPVDGPQDTFSEARPLTAFPEAEAVAPAGTCAAITELRRKHGSSMNRSPGTSANTRARKGMSNNQQND